MLLQCSGGDDVIKIMKNNTLKILSGTIGLLFIPLVAMLFTNEVNWNIGDFAVMGAMLFGTGHLVTWSWQKLGTSRLRWIALGAIVLTFLLVWAELAVGLFG